MTSASFPSQTLQVLLFMKAALSLSLQRLQILVRKGTSWFLCWSFKHFTMMSKNSGCSCWQSYRSLTYSSSFSVQTRHFWLHLTESLMIWVHLLHILPHCEILWIRLLCSRHGSSISFVRLLWKSCEHRDPYFTSSYYISNLYTPHHTTPLSLSKSHQTRHL